MGIIVIELILMLILNRKLEKKGIKLHSRLIFAALIQVIILFIYRFNLDMIGREVYYSDAEVYWNETLRLLDGGKLVGNQVGYSYFSALVQYFSPIKSVIWNNISNVLLLDLSVILAAYTMSLYDVERYNIRSFVTICLTNPLVIYSLARNLKDALFIFLAISIVHLYIVFDKKRKLRYIAFVAMLSIVISSIRPWGFLIMPMMVIEKLLTSPKEYRGRNILLSAILFSVFLVVVRFTNLWGHVNLWMPIVLAKAKSIGTSGLIIAPMKILTGPGPYRSLMGSKYFLFTILSGNVFSAIGSVAWWWCLSTYISNFRKLNLKNTRYPFLIIALFFILIYSMQYGGSLELRFRGVIYILTTAAFMSLCSGRYNGSINKDNLLIFIAVFIGATLFSV